LIVGPIVPEVTIPTFYPFSKNISVFSLIGILSPTNPTLFLATPSLICFLVKSSEIHPNYSFLRFEIVQESIASIGEIFSSSSCPYKHRPASNLKESRAPSPTGTAIYSLDSFFIVHIFSINASTS
jgi:hypothetical protein